jgi:hypothetical protein
MKEKSAVDWPIILNSVDYPRNYYITYSAIAAIFAHLMFEWDTAEYFLKEATNYASLKKALND